jgi:exosortase D (VPLPA-CTERM-specific)
MTREASIPSVVVWRLSPVAWTVVGTAVVLLLLSHYESLLRLYSVWTEREEYGFGLIVPFVAAFLVWQRKDLIEQCRFEGSWAGVAALACGLGLAVLGKLSTLGTFTTYAFLLSLFGLVLSGCGWKGVRLLAGPLLILFFMVPLPNLLLVEINVKLQLLSSQLGVALIRLAGVSVYLEGNVIDLGTMKLQVVEACSGLRYLLPLLTLGFISAYFYKVALWKRVVLVLSTIPITILMNSARIAVVGITAEYFGKAAAEGFLHDFEGWVVFMLSIGAMLVVMVLLARVGGDRRSLREIFGMELPSPTPRGAAPLDRPLPSSFLAATGLLVITAAVLSFMPEPHFDAPARRDLSAFPLELGGWRGRTEPLDPGYLDVLKLDDYLLADYADGAGSAVNAYIAYYASQRDSNSNHSPRGCLPGDGWEIQSFTESVLPGASPDGVPLPVNRVVIQKGESRQLVYYWFPQRGRLLTDEYAVKLWILRDLVVRGRSDGALVRLVTPLRPGEAEQAADSRLTTFAALVQGQLSQFVPD